jgi:hypothetical protein
MAVDMPVYVVVLEATYLVVLLLAAVVYITVPSLRLIPDPIGPIPLGVPFFGGLGGVLIRCFGIFFHNEEWDRSYLYWYLFGPLIGFALGAVAYLIFVVTIQATGTKANTNGGMVYYLVAFLAGYREEVFQQLIQHAIDVILKPGEPAKKPGG